MADMKTRFPHYALSAIAAGALAFGLAGAMKARPDAEPAVHAVWAGGPTLLLRFGPIELVTDPVLGEGADAFRMFDPNTGVEDAAHARLVALPALDFAQVDLVLVSHDHLDASAIAELGTVPHVVPAGEGAALTQRGVSTTIGLAWGETMRIEDAGYEVVIEAVPARHSPVPDIAAQLGGGNGYWLTFTHGDFTRSLYWTGDTFPGAGIPEGREPPDWLVPHLGGVGQGGPFGPVSMTAEDAARFARDTGAAAVLPIHHSTFSLYREPIEAFVTASEGEAWQVVIPEPGEDIVLR